MKKKIIFIMFILLICFDKFPALSANEIPQNAQNPIIWADVPDPSVVRFGDTYYMSSTTMHMNPGLPIMKSKDLVNWEMVRYCYDIIADDEIMNLENGQNAYGKGSWASSIKYHNGIFYIVTFSYNTGKTHIYQTKDIEKGELISIELSKMCHDPSLFFDDDRVFLIYGVDDIRIIELNTDVTDFKSGGLDQILIPKASQIAGTNFYVPAEGSHIYKIADKYYVFLISWPAGSMRTELVYRSDTLTGTYEGQIALRDNGIAQGGIIDTPTGDWYAFLFQDHGAVGRIPYVVPMTWSDGWPVMGNDGKVPDELNIPVENDPIPKIVSSDEFDWENDMPMAWQWNHNPVNEKWSTTERAGFLRITNSRIDTTFLETQNTLTQRTFGPECAGKVAMDVSNMKNGDVAGLGMLQKNYGYVAVKMENDTKSLIMVSGTTDPAKERETIVIDQNIVYLRITCDFKNKRDRAYFYYSLDGIEWKAIGKSLTMSYTLPHFMGYRFALFNYATQETGGYVDFDYFRINNSLTETTSINQNNKALPDKIELYDNYPNPFNPSTQIGFYLPKSQDIKVKIYNINGQEIDTLMEGIAQAGQHKLTWVPQNTASGIYFCSLQTEGFNSYDKMSFLK